ncbi:MAG: hypothetical protein U5K79_02620 [Cyclobacteriaceae bacterium]|nr:hypothetical protein [Cyclobacteriaceae bacterium]
MKTSDFRVKPSPTIVNGYEESVMNIYQYLNQGNLFRIYQLLDSVGSIEDKRMLEDLFVQRFGFNYRSFI